jgi:hypothetical protein
VTNKRNFLKLITLLCVFLAYSPYTYANKANLVLYPTRLVLDNNERTATVMIKNNGNASGKYRVELVDMQMLEEGGIIEIKDREEPYSAKNMLRISPRSVIINANSDQNIRIMVRKSKDIKDGEYRSHLKVTMVEDNVDHLEEKDANDNPIKLKGVGITVKSRLVLVIPVIIKHGAVNYNVDIIDAKLKNIKNTISKKDELFAEIMMKREGNGSSMGDIDISYINPNGKKYLLKHVNGIAIYRSSERRKLTLPLDLPEGLKIGKGKLVVSYKGQEKEKNSILAEKEFNL